MPKMILHLVRQGGAVEHLPMTKQNWEMFVNDPSVVRQWSHREDACVDPLDELAERLKRRGYKPAPKMVSAEELTAARVAREEAAAKAVTEAEKAKPGQLSLF